jgi:Protein of unknown function (DUF2510)
VSYRPPGDRDDPAERQPPGWYLDPRSYLDPAGQQVLRWWDGRQWGQQTQPLPRKGQEPPIAYPQQSYGQDARTPSFTPDPQYGMSPGQPLYQGNPQYPGTPYGQYPSPQAQPYGQLPGSPSGHYGRPPRNSWPRRHKALTVLGGLVALIIIGSIATAAGGSNQASPSTPAAAESSPAFGPTSSPPTQASIRASDSPATGTSNDTLTGFGATVSVWNAHHMEDTKFAPNAAYDPNPALPSYSGQDVYVAVQWQDGRALNYQMNIPGQSIRDAITRALQELPPDAHEVWG